MARPVQPIRGKFSDLDLTFGKNPFTRDVSILTDELAVRRAIRNIVLTRMTEKPFDAYFGTRVQGLLFELERPGVVDAIRNEIIYALRNYEPRAKVISVVAEQKDEGKALEVVVTFQIAQNPPVELNLGTLRV